MAIKATTEEKKDDRIDRLESKVNAMSRILDNICHEAEKYWRKDFNRDGVIGKAGRTTLPALLVVLIGTALLTFGAVIWNVDNGSRTGDAKIEHDGTDYTLTVDKAVVESVTSSGVLTGVPAAGAKTGTTVTATESYGVVNKTVLTLVDTLVVITDLTGTTNSCGGTKIYDFPEGEIYILGFAVDNFTWTTNATIDADFGGDFAFGTAVGTGADLTSTEIDMTDAKVSIDPITNTVDAVTELDDIGESRFDGTATAKDLYVNLLADGADIDATCTNAVSATVTIHWINLGDD